MEFELTKEHLKLMRYLYIRKDRDNVPYISQKRPLGNGCLDESLEEIFGQDGDTGANREHLVDLDNALKVVLEHNGAAPGMYTSADRGFTWDKVLTEEEKAEAERELQHQRLGHW